MFVPTKINNKKKKMKKGLIITGVLVLLIGGLIANWGVGLSNSEIKLAERGNAQQEVCSAYFDKMWKILKQQAGVADQYKEAFKEIYPALMEGRYSNGGEMMKWITEANPEFDASMYKTLMSSIEGQREGFFVEQTKLIDINREHVTMRKTFPNKLIIGKRHNIGYVVDEDGKVIKDGITIIKSQNTNDAYATGEENNIELF